VFNREIAMASTSRNPPALQTDGALPLLSLNSTLVDNLFQIQRSQLNALMSWQKSAASIGQELWDEWACHFGGGIPIDG
jgi:hypothetical protein